MPKVELQTVNMSEIIAHIIHFSQSAQLLVVQVLFYIKTRAYISLKRNIVRNVFSIFV